MRVCTWAWRSERAQAALGLLMAGSRSGRARKGDLPGETGNGRGSAPQSPRGSEGGEAHTSRHTQVVNRSPL